MSIHVLAVADFDDGHDKAIIRHGIQDTVTPVTEPVFSCPRELHAAVGPWIGRKGPDSCNDPPPILLGRDRLDFLDGGRLDKEPISFHAASDL